jgi:uncharacterized protein (DUF885 family)
MSRKKQTRTIVGNIISYRTRKLLAAGVSLAMAVALTGCSLKSSVYNKISSITDTSNTYHANSSDDGNQDFDDYMKELFVEAVTTDTVSLHFSVKDPEAYGITDYDITWGEDPFSEETINKDKTDINDVISTLQSYDYDSLSESQQLTYDILMEKEETSLKFYDYLDYYEPFAYTSGVQTNFTITMAEYAFYTEEDVQNYLILMDELPEYMDYYLDFEKQRSENGYFMSDASADNVIEQCQDFISNVDNHYLIQTFNSRIEDLNLDEATVSDYEEQNKDIVINQILPEYEKIIDAFEEMKGSGTNENGLYYYDQGQEYYEYLLESDVGTDMTPDEIIDLLDSKLASLMTEYMMSAYTDYDAYEDFYNEDFSYPSTDPSTILSSLEVSASNSFPICDGMDYSVVYVDKSLEDSLSPAFCFSPCIDDYLNNNIYINGGSTDDSSIWSTLCHEGYPGHLYQFAYFYSTNPAPIRTALNFNGYSEGWAEYVEMMSFDWAISEDYDSAIANFAEINDRLNLYVSARIEIGVNYEGWTVSDCSDYLNDMGFNGDAAEDIFDYVVAEPANYQMYCVGMLTFESLQEKASSELGSDFDLTEFHDVVLSTGPCQFDILEQEVDNYIQSK